MFNIPRVYAIINHVLLCFKEDDILIESEEEIISGEDHDHVQHLKAKKEELEKKMKEKTKQQENQQVQMQ